LFFLYLILATGFSSILGTQWWTRMKLKSCMVINWSPNYYEHKWSQFDDSRLCLCWACWRSSGWRIKSSRTARVKLVRSHFQDKIQQKSWWLGSSTKSVYLAYIKALGSIPSITEKKIYTVLRILNYKLILNLIGDFRFEPTQVCWTVLIYL
jgi:hypothetical protein